MDSSHSWLDLLPEFNILVSGKQLASRMLESRIYRIEEFFLAERFVQKGYRAGFERARAGIVICVRGDENDRDSPVGRNHLTLEIESVHAGHSHVENQACRIARLIRTQKRVRRR